MTRGTVEHPAVPSAADIRSQLAQVIASRAFARSERQQKFLRHTVEAAVEGRAEVLKESTLGVEIFNRGSDFDARADNIVRVEARRLRQRLQDYYLNEGAADAVLIDLQPGGYVPQFSWKTTAAAPPAPRSWKYRAAAAGMAVLGLAIAAVLIWFPRREAPLIAVLPFVEYEAGEAGPYLGDGIAEDILQLLAETPRLRVVSRTSTFRFRGPNLDLSAIRNRLGAKLLLEGNVRRNSGRIRIAARLVDAGTGVPVWADTRETDAAGLDGAERTLAAGVASALKAGSLRPLPGHLPPAEARDLLARARYLAARGGAANRQQAVALYEQAVTLDPGYARAWAELARILSLIAFHDSVEADRLAPRIRDAAARALRLDGTLADPHFALARLAWSHEWNWNAAESGWLKTLEINPNYAGAHQAYALGLMSRGRFREALEHSRRARELDPMSYAASNDLGLVLYAARQFDQAAAHARASLSLAPESPYPRILLGIVEAARNRPVEAAAEFEQTVSSLSRDPGILGRLGNVYARSGRVAEAQAVLSELQRNPDAGRIYMAMVETGLGHRDRALELLEMSLARRESDVVFAGIDPVFDPLLREPRFQAVCRKLNLPPR
ncbi:tetratricopeptide repeat protein [Paludibaculum fermentans]|uniref:tetratricopeptide repeat protein n=1 Tax=Paludibaculum fermentans TaxID=1473598 RepID=UPI003EBC1FDD